MGDPNEINRLLASSNDLMEAAGFLDAFTAFQDVRSDQGAPARLAGRLSSQIENSLLASAIVSYARPFTDSRGPGPSKLAGVYLARLSKEERKLHDRIVESRNKVVAHSDQEHFAYASSQDGGAPVRSVSAPTVSAEGGMLELNTPSSVERRSLEGTPALVVVSIDPGIGVPQIQSVEMTSLRRFYADDATLKSISGMITKITLALRSRVNELQPLEPPSHYDQDEP